MPLLLAATPASASAEAAGALLAVFLVVVAIVCALALYFVPSVVAFSRRVPHKWGVVLVNVFVGWTVLGWLWSLLWALQNGPRPQIPIPEPLAPPSPSAGDTLYLTAPLQPVVAPGVVKRANETFYWVVPRADLLAEQKDTDYDAQTNQTAVQVFSGINDAWGNFHLQEAHRLAVDLEDSGMLALSDQRALFLGNRLTIEIAYDDVAAVATFRDGFRINRKSAAPVIVRTGSPREAGVLQRLINGEIGPRLATAPANVLPPGPARP
ncbi:MAG TPA: superinfection immunity protein [Candidatus Elarobacter sp.]